MVDGELARLRESCSPTGVYLDYRAHYFVYTSAGFGLGVRVWGMTGNAADVMAGFGIGVGLMMNLASKDYWHRANFAKSCNVEGRQPMWRGSAITIVAARVMSGHTVWFAIAVATAVAWRLQPVSSRVPEIILYFYGVTMPCFAIARAAVTGRHGHIPRRRAWY